MKHRPIIKKYTYYLTKATIAYATGFLGLAITAIIEICFPNRFVPGEIYVMILGLALIFGSYSAFANLLKESKTKEKELNSTINELKSKVRELQNKQPNLVIGFQDENNHLTKTLHFQLNPLPPKSTIDTWIEKEVQKELERLAEKERKNNSRHTGIGLLRANPNYRQELKQYEEKYCAYVRRQFEFFTAKTRAYAVKLVVENTGHHPANNVDIEFKMPEEYCKPADHQYPPLEHSFYDSPLYQNLRNDSEMTKEEIMLTGIEYICKRPSEPKKFTDITTNLLYSVPPDAFTSPLIETQSISEKLSSVTGPAHKTQQGIHYITYHIDQLVQHRPLDLDPFYIWLGDISHSTIWEIIVQITSADLQKPHEETLIINIEVLEDTKLTSD
jgi:hypothetical protein